MAVVCREQRRGDNHQERAGNEQPDADAGLGKCKGGYQPQGLFAMGVQPLQKQLFDDELSRWSRLLG